MGEYLVKPYEISVWEDKLTQDGFEEIKLAVIGSNTMTGLNKIYNPVFHKKTNGEKTLSFSLKYEYFDPYSGADKVVNPFAALLVNERKVKLYYDNQWYEFIVRDHTESSDGLEWTYTCTDAFVLELSKIGYNITFDAELNNNQGTVAELAYETIKDTDWQLGNTNIGRQYIAEPIYEATLESTSGIKIVNTDNTGEVINSNTPIYLFYSYVKNQNGKFVQFIIRDENRSYNIDEKNIITDTNFRIETELSYEFDGFYLNDTKIISWDIVDNRFQANRLVYNQLTTYDPVMEHTVERYKVNTLEVYKYTKDIYTTSNIVTNLITNGDNFNVLEDGSLQGWNPYVATTGTVQKLELVTYPELGTGKSLVELTALSQIEGYLKVHFPGAFSNYQNAVYNSGIENNAYLINSISQGDKFIFRWRATKNIGSSVGAENLRLLVAKYEQDAPSFGYYYKHIQPNDIILQFDGIPQEFNNIIKGGTIEQGIDGNNLYVIDGVPQAVSTKYIYQSEGQNYVWNGQTQLFEPLNDNYLPYYYLIAEAQQAVANTVLTSSTEKIGIFIYNTEGEETYYIQDIQLTRYFEDANGDPVLIGNTPEATIIPTSYFYLKPSENATIEDIKTYTTTEQLKADLGLTPESKVEPLYNEDSEKYLTISVSQSNCFNILQTIAETFECWVDLEVQHESNGAIKYLNGVPQKFVHFREYIGDENWAGFKYGINLESIERNINSDEIVTKLIVNQSQSDYVDEGYVSIALAPSNISGESYILNFDYYYNQGLLNKTQVEIDKLNFIFDVSELNYDIQQKEKERRELDSSLVVLNSQRNFYADLIATAQNTQTQALEEFADLKKQSYDDYRRDHSILEPSEQLTEEETILGVLGKIYNSSAIINNYSGFLTSVEQEYWKVRKTLYGSENYSLTIWTAIDANQIKHIYIELNDYLQDFSFYLSNSSEIYTTTVNQKFFDIEVYTDETITITFYPPQGYTITPNQYVVVDEEARFKIISSSTEEGLVDQINKLLDDKANLIKAFENKYQRFIQEGTWSSTDYIDSELYYLDAVQVSNLSAQPKVSYTINVVEVSELEGLENYLFDVGDKTYVEDTEFFGWANKNNVLTPAREEVIISEVEWHLDTPEENVITVQNYKTRFEDLFQRINSTIQTVQYNEATYAKISSLMDADGTINQDVLLASLNNISGKQYNLTSDGSIRIDGDRITVRNLTNKSNVVIINSEGIRISSDGGEHWQTAISGRGIDAGAVYTGSLNTDNIIIGNKNNPSFRWDKSGISAYGSTKTINQENQEVDTYDLKTYVRFDQYGLYGIKQNETFTARSLQDVKNNAHFAVTWDGFFIRNSYTDGRVEISSDNDFQVIQTISGVDHERIKIGALEFNNVGQPTKYGIRIKDRFGTETFVTGDDGDVTVTGTINALGGNFSGIVNVGETNQDHIIIDGINASIATSNYQDGAGYGWMINKDGDAVFNNITARGAIKTAVFEYAEIQAVGGIFIFRPSSTIRSAIIAQNNTDLILTVEKPVLFKIGNWCKISNYTGSGEADNPEVDLEDENESAQNILKNNGLTHVYQISNISHINNTTYITLNGAAAMIGQDKAVATCEKLIGGALVDMGNTAGTSNYGIGVNSSDNTVNLPARAISLFETVVDDSKDLKVSYKYRGILGTLPILQYSGPNKEVSPLYHRYLAGTQGIYTDNMYIGDGDQYIAFYTDTNDNNKKKLKINAKEIIYGVDEDDNEITWEDKINEAAQGADGEDAIDIYIDSSAGNIFVNSVVSTILRCYVYKGGVDITNDNNYRKVYTWKKINIEDGSEIQEWTPTAVAFEPNAIQITTNDVTHKAVFQCSVIVEEA